MKIIDYTNIQNNKHDIYVFLSRFDIFYTGKLFSHSFLFWTRLYRVRFTTGCKL